MNADDKLKPDPRWYVNAAGTFANDPVYDEIMRLGREYRESLRPKPKGRSGRTRKQTQENRMATVADIEKRVKALEAELAELRVRLLAPDKPAQITDFFGIFANDPTFEEAVRLGREWRDEENRKSLEEFDREERGAKAKKPAKKPASMKRVTNGRV